MPGGWCWATGICMSMTDRNSAGSLRSLAERTRLGAHRFLSLRLSTLNANGTRDAALVPAGSIAGRSLVTVVAIMTFLCALTAGAGVLVQSAASDWRRSIAAEVTIQIRPISGQDVDAAVEKAAAIARDTPGVAFVTPVDPADPPTLAGLRTWVRERLADYKAPDELELLTELPLTPMLKVDRAALTARLRAE